MRQKFIVLLSALLVLVALTGCTSQNVQLGKPEIRSISYEFGEVTEDYTEVKTIVEVYNPNPVAIPLKDVKTEIYMNGIKTGEGSAEEAEIAANSVSKIILVTKIDNEKIPEWWASHLRNGEKTEMLIRANLIFDLKLFEFSYPIEKRETFETSMLSKISLSSPKELRFASLKLLLRSVQASWGEITNETSEIILKARIQNENDVEIPLPKMECEITMNNLKVAEGFTDSPVILSPGEETEVKMRVLLDNTLLDDWWVSHIKNGERTEVEVFLNLSFKYGGKEYEVPIGGLKTELRTNLLG